jgi:hypothetical protein
MSKLQKWLRRVNRRSKIFEQIISILLDEINDENTLIGEWV